MIFGSLEILKRNNLLSDIIVLMSNSLQKITTHVNFFATLLTNHSPVTISISKNKDSIRYQNFLEIQLCFQTKILFIKTKNLI